MHPAWLKSTCINRDSHVKVTQATKLTLKVLSSIPNCNHLQSDDGPMFFDRREIYSHMQLSYCHKILLDVVFVVILS